MEVGKKVPRVIADSGCRNAVAGEIWHELVQEHLGRAGIQWKVECEKEIYQFGAGLPETSTKAFIYPCCLMGEFDAVRI